VADAFTPGSHLSTCGGNPVSCAAALANIEVMRDEDLPGNAEARGAQIQAALAPLQDDLTLVGEVRGRGLMIGIELVRDAERTPAPELAQETKRRCRELGILVGVGGTFGNVVRIQPPLVLSEDDAGMLCDRLSRVLRELDGSL
jgi:4-aminobutyrate aminotransferase-like enzyme